MKKSKILPIILSLLFLVGCANNKEEEETPVDPNIISEEQSTQSWGPLVSEEMNNRFGESIPFIDAGYNTWIKSEDKLSSKPTKDGGFDIAKNVLDSNSSFKKMSWFNVFLYTKDLGVYDQLTIRLFNTTGNIDCYSSPRYISEWKANDVSSHLGNNSLPEPNGSSFRYYFNENSIAIDVVGSYDDYCLKLQSSNFPASTQLGSKLAYSNENLVVDLTKYSENEFTIVCFANSDAGFSSEFPAKALKNKLSAFTNLYPNEKSMLEGVVQPDEGTFSYHFLNDSYFNAVLDVKNCTLYKYKLKLLLAGFIQLESNHYSRGNLGLNIIDITDDGFSVELFEFELPKLDFEHLNYCTKDYGYSISVYGEEMYLDFKNNSIVGDYVNKQDQDPEVSLHIDRSGCNNYQLHIFGYSEHYYRHYDFILEYSFITNKLFKVSDNSY